MVGGEVAMTGSWSVRRRAAWLAFAATVAAPLAAMADVVPGPSCKCSVAGGSGAISLGGALVVVAAVAAVVVLRALQRPAGASGADTARR